MNITNFIEHAPREIRTPGRSRLTLAFRVLAAVSLIGFLFLYFDFKEIARNLTSIDGSYAVLAIAVISAQYLLSCLRWHYILRRHDQPFSFRRSFSVYGIGALANLVLVTSIAGLSVRGLLLLREKVGLLRVIGVLLVERVAALGGMTLCILGGLAISHRLLLEYLEIGSNSFAGLWIGVLAVLAAALLAVLLFQLKPVRRIVAQIRESFMSVDVVALLIVISAGIIFLGFASVAVLAKGMAIDIDPIFFVSVMPVVAFMAALPISVGGWGVREGMMVIGLALFNVPAESALALSVAYGFAGVAVACFFGAIALLVYVLIWRGRSAAGIGS